MTDASGFLLNARPSTVVPGYLRQARCSGYLFPPDQSTAALTRRLRATRSFVLADDGAFDEIGKISNAVSAAAGGDTGLLVDGIAQASAAIDANAALATQLAVRPDAIIGPEDVMVAAWLRSGLRDSDLRPERRRVAARNAAVAKAAASLEARNGGVPCLPVAAAFDYDSAFDAGRIFAQEGTERASMGFGAYMADDSWMTDFKVRGHVRHLPRRLPARYLRSALVSRGFFDGWRSGTHRTLKHFHYLGLGAPIMMPLGMLAAADAVRTTFDATSPIRDATDGSIYVSVPASLTVRTWKVAANVALSSPETGWACPCRFCRTSTANHPFNWAQAAVAIADRAATSSKDLKQGGRLAASCPLFGIGSGSLAASAQAARIGHNHWVVGSLTQRLARVDSLTEAAARQVNAYADHAGADHYAQAVQLAFQIIEQQGGVIA